MQLLVNSLIEYLNDTDHSLIVRLLYLNSSGARVAVIDVDSRTAQPVWHDRAELEQSLASGMARVLARGRGYTRARALGRLINKASGAVSKVTPSSKGSDKKRSVSRQSKRGSPI